MLKSDSAPIAELTTRQAPATFARREVRHDPTWEQDFAAFLRNSQSKEELQGLFGQFRAGESFFDQMMRRILMRALCKRVGSDLQVGPNGVLKHPETMEFV